MIDQCNAETALSLKPVAYFMQVPGASSRMDPVDAANDLV